MAEINQSDVIEKLIKGLGLQAGKDKIPTEILDKVQPVFDVIPIPKLIVKSIDLSDGSSQTILTTSSSKGTYLIGLDLSLSKDVVNDGLFTEIRATIEETNAFTDILTIRYEPVTAGQFRESIIFPFPIKLQKNTTVGLYNNSSTASIDVTAKAIYYERDEV